MENLRFSIGAGETKVFVKAGRYFEILDAAGAVTLAFYDESGNQHNDARNVLSGTYLSERYSSFDITSSITQEVEIFVSDGNAGTKRQPGVVSVVDGERQKVAAGVCFRATPSQAGNAPTCQIYNPAGSGKNIYLQAVRAGALNADSWGVRTTTTQHAVDQGNGKNLDVTAPDSVARVRCDNNPTPAAARFMSSGYVSASSDVVIVFPRPILVRPGHGVDFYVNANPNTIRAAFEWEEWPV